MPIHQAIVCSAAQRLTPYRLQCTLSVMAMVLQQLQAAECCSMLDGMRAVDKDGNDKVSVS